MTPAWLPAADPPRHAWFKATLFALLGCNTALYVASGTVSEALDTAAWLVLLILFELETDFGARFHEERLATLVRGARLTAAVAVIAAAIGYLRDEEWLDAINAGLWIAIVAVMEIQVRYSRTALARRTVFTAVTAVLYAGLGALAAIWIWQGEWFDAYDALLWLAALVVIEMNILRGLGGVARSGSGAPG